MVSIVTTPLSFSADHNNNIHIAIAGPMSGADASNGQAMLKGATLYADYINKQGGINGKKLIIHPFDDQNNPKLAKEQAIKIVNDGRFTAVIGHNYSSCSLVAGKIYKQHKLLAITPTSTDNSITENNPWYYRMIFNDTRQGKFLVNYAVKILKHHNIYIIHDQTTYGSELSKVFIQTAQQLDIPHHAYLLHEKNSTDNTSLPLFIKKLKNFDPNGAIFLAMHVKEGIQVVQQIRDAGLTQRIITPDSFASQKFVTQLKTFAREKSMPGFYTHGIYVSTPLSIDVVSKKAQAFKANYIHQEGEMPDWPAAFAYDSMLLLVNAMQHSTFNATSDNLAIEREKLRLYLAQQNTRNQGIEGVTGFTYFDQFGNAQKNITMGIYQGQQLVAAAIQLYPGRLSTVFLQTNKEAHHKLKTHITIDQQYMSITNVVYTGIKFHSIDNIDPINMTFDAKFTIWFRYQGDLQPQNIIFTNALTPIELKEPIKKYLNTTVKYQLYQVQGKFRMNSLSELKVPLGQHILGISFHHLNLFREHLLYVTDSIGLETKYPHHRIINNLIQNNVISMNLNWRPKKIWFYQSSIAVDALGSPQLIAKGNYQALFSQFNAAIQIHPDYFTLRGSIPLHIADYMLYPTLIIFLLLLFLGKYRPLVQIPRITWFLQMLTAFILLLVTEIVFAAILFDTASIGYIKRFIIVFDVLWWFVPAIFIALALEHFLWSPLETRTNRLIPKFVKRIISFIILLLALFAVVAFVFDQKLTSLLATSGLVAMIIGLAIQVNIANIFSGLALNIEQPFRIGDWVIIQGYQEGKVVDINWRTTKILHRNQTITCIPNSVAADNAVTNMDSPDNRVEIYSKVYVDANQSPWKVEKILVDALISTSEVLLDPAPFASYKGVENGQSRYTIGYTINNYCRRTVIAKAVMKNTWKHLHDADISCTLKTQYIELSRPPHTTTKPAQNIKLFKQLESFHYLSDEEIETICQYMKLRCFNQGDLVIRQKEQLRHMYLIAEGSLSIQIDSNVGKNIELGRLGVGDFFGEEAFLMGKPRTASVIACSYTRIYEIQPDLLDEYLNKHPDLKSKFETALHERMTTIQKDRRSSIKNYHRTHNVSNQKKNLFKRIQSFFKHDKIAKIDMDNEVVAVITPVGQPSFSVVVDSLYKKGFSFCKDLTHLYSLNKGDQLKIEIHHPCVKKILLLEGHISYHVDLIEEGEIFDKTGSECINKYGVEFYQLSIQKSKLITQMIQKIDDEAMNLI